MHCDGGVWHANVTVHGAWGPGLGYTFDRLVSAPPPLRARRRMIERGHPWFSLVDLELPPSNRRPEMALHLASITGTLWVPDVEAELLAKADAIVFYAETASHQLERTRIARRTLDGWIAERAVPVVVFQLDRPYLGGLVTTYDPATGSRDETPVVALDAATLRAELAIDPYPFVETNAREGQLGMLLRTIVERLLTHHDRLPRRPSYEDSTGG